LFTIITFSIYPIVFFCSLTSDLNVIASRYDGKRTMHYALLLFVIGPLTLSIAYFVWFHKMSGRIGNELKRRGIDYSFGSGTFWLWFVLGLLIGIGPFVYLHKLCKSMNLMSEHYNDYG
jgi:hypothetical protein